MNIALTALSCDSVTGIGRIVSSLAAEYVRAGHETTVVAQAFGGAPSGPRQVRLWRPPLSRAAQRIAFSYGTRTFFSRHRFDIVNAFGVGRGANVVSAQSCHRAGMEARSRYARERISSGGWGLFDAVSLHDERVLMSARSTLRVIAVSQRVADDLVRFYGISPSKIRVVPNGIPLLQGRPTEPERKSLRAAAGAAEGDFLLLFVGNEFDRKGLQTVLEAMAVLNDPNIRLFVAGEDDKAPFERRAAALGIRGRIRFGGLEGNIERLYAIADAFVFPTYYEPFGMVIIEAMGAGLPVIASALAGATEGLVHGTHGLYLRDPLSAEELAAQVRLLRTDADLYRRLAEGGREASRRFSWDRIARKTIAVYEEASRILSGELP